MFDRSNASVGAIPLAHLRFLHFSRYSSSDLNKLERAYGHRLVPVELDTMIKIRGMKEEIMMLRSLATSFLVPSSQQKKLWTLSDASSTVAYLAQHPLLDQIPALCQDIVLSPRLCRTLWKGTGATRTPLHFSL